MFISQTTDFHFANYRFSFRKLQIFISQTTDSHFANYRFSFRKLQILISQTTDFHFGNYRFSFRKLQISISQTTDFHFANYRFPFRFVPFRFANYSKPKHSTLAKWTIAKRLVSETTCNHGVRFAECVILSGKALEGKQLTFSFQVILFEFTGNRNILRKLLEYIK